ncbi:hypothetical protein BIW11_04636 [Tropilaelaps mercedesae]|uniref:Uncharacterized protein n=1 Tax=Tropilaelaps mercedesae TaxID=418985 RepID=A0A1V9X484_9ACAR|nr:hypothetical protein BIW11_04636 [Tropilaelaps mercedesae]
MEEKFILWAISRWCVERCYSLYFSSVPIAKLWMYSLASKTRSIQLLEDIDMSLNTENRISTDFTTATVIPFMRKKDLLQGYPGCLAGNEMKTLESMKAV